MGNLEAAENAYFGRENPKEETKQTNGDRIRSMTDRELAFFLVSKESNACTYCEYHDKKRDECCLDSHIVCVKELAAAEIWDWLASEAEEKENEADPVHNGAQDIVGADLDHRPPA